MSVYGKAGLVSKECAAPGQARNQATRIQGQQGQSMYGTAISSAVSQSSPSSRSRPLSVLKLPVPGSNSSSEFPSPSLSRAATGFAAFFARRVARHRLAAAILAEAPEIRVEVRATSAGSSAPV
jgi:hypothetical protein